MRISPISDYVLANYNTVNSGLTNCIATELNGVKAVTTRPIMMLLYDVSFRSTTGVGRGVFYWETNSTTYYVQGGTVYRTAVLSSTVVGNLTANAKERVYFAQCGSLLMLLDPQNNDAWTIDAAHTMTKITDADFPSTLAHGLVVLNGTAYVLDDSGNIYGSDIDDPTSWNALNVLNAERSPDGGIFIAGISDHVVVVGKDTIEFFYDAGNATGSPLNRREDIEFKLGSTSFTAASFAQSSDILFFVAETGYQGNCAYMINGISAPVKISNDMVTNYISRIETQYYLIGASFSESGHTYYSISFLNPISSTSFSEVATIVYDLSTGLWHPWSSSLGGISTFPIISYKNVSNNIFGATRVSGLGINVIGDIVAVGNLSTNLASDWVIDPQSSENATGFSCQIDTGDLDFGTSNTKFFSSFRLNSIYPYGSEFNLYSLSYANERSSSYSTPVKMNSGTTTTTTFPPNKVMRLGRGRRKNFRITWTTTEQLYQTYIESFDIDFTVGTS